MALKKPPFTVGIVGASGSGKHALTRALCAHFGEVALISQTDYARSRDELAYPERVRINYEHPSAYEHGLLAAHLRGLRWGNSVDAPVYDKVKHLRADAPRRISSSPLILVRGPLLFTDEELSAQFDLRIYLDTDADLRLARRILRDVCERGRTMQSVIDQYTTTVKPMHEEFVEPSKRYADVIIPEGGFNSVAVGMLIENIRSLINKE